MVVTMSSQYAQIAKTAPLLFICMVQEDRSNRVVASYDLTTHLKYAKMLWTT